jgi:hypothetical protein
MVLSIIFNVKIVMVHNSGYTHTINANLETTSTNTIHLGLIGESHYVPLDVIDSTENLSVPRYDDGRVRYFSWAVKMWREINKHLFQPNKNTESESESESDITLHQNKKNQLDTDTFTSITVPQDMSNSVTFT